MGEPEPKTTCVRVSASAQRVHPGDPERAPGEELGGEVAERCDHLRLDQLDLAEEMRLARLDLVRLRIAVAGGPALEDVRDIDVVAPELDAGEQAVEQLPGLADERDALLVLVEARRLADEHQVGIGRAGAEHHLCAGVRERTLRAAGDGVAVGEQAQSAISVRSHRNRRNSRRHRSWAVRRCRALRTR